MLNSVKHPSLLEPFIAARTGARPQGFALAQPVLPAARHPGRYFTVRAALVVAAVVTAVCWPWSAAAQDSKSAALAQELAQLMGSRKLDSVAAKGASGEDRFVAALFFPGQLLVVSARYEVPMYVEQKIAKQQYRDVYIDLNAASIAGSKVLVTDGGANGLMAQRLEGQAFDIWDTGARVLRFDGNWDAQKMSEQEYMKTFADSDAQYAIMLQALLRRLKQ